MTGAPRDLERALARAARDPDFLRQLLSALQQSQAVLERLRELSTQPSPAARRGEEAWMSMTGATKNPPR